MIHTSSYIHTHVYTHVCIHMYINRFMKQKDYQSSSDIIIDSKYSSWINLYILGNPVKKKLPQHSFLFVLVLSTAITILSKVAARGSIVSILRAD